MNSLRFIPSVFVVGNEYEIILCPKERGIVLVEVGGKVYCEDKSGVIPLDVEAVKVRVPQAALDKAEKYTVVFRKVIEKKAYWSTFEPPVTCEYDFKPLKKKDDINLYQLADVHYAFDTALKTGKYFGDETDIFVLNGDIGEVEKRENFYDVLAFTGELSSGKIPMIFTRGNHDTRGKLSEKFCDFFPTDGGKTYYKFNLGVLGGVVLDCGEDKPDVNPEYDNSENTPQKYRGINAFHAYRERQADFLENVEFDEKSVYKFAICHIPPVYTTKNKGSIFDIEKDIYEKWSSCLERAGINFMLCGHIHSAFILSGDDERSTAHHEYPVVIGSRLFPAGADLWGAAINLKGGVATVKFTDKAGEVVETHTLDFNK